MKKKKLVVYVPIILFACIAVVVYWGMAGQSSTSTKGTIKSAILNETRGFSVYLPPGYHAFANRKRVYPILYLFHGFSDSHIGWVRHGNLRKIADEMIENGRAVPMIIVVPHTLGGFYTNRVDGSYSYENFFFKEFVPFIEKKYRVHQSKESRAIAGVSMGGNGALLYAMKYPEMVVSCCTLGAAVNFNESPDTESTNELVSTNENDIDALLRKTADNLRNADPDVLKRITVQFHIDCGKEDGLCATNEKLDAKMTANNIPHTFKTRSGRHDWDCWRAALPDSLEFSSKAFRHSK